jgi:predicted enzyme related to lactoylglutathione lyase
MTANGQVVWWEIETPDPDGSQRFYGELFGWTFRKDFDQPGSQLDRAYWIIESDGRALGGLQRALPGAPAAQVGVRLYVEVSDLEAVLAQAEALGAEVERVRTYLGADDFWFANFRDPQGISVGLWTANPASAGSRTA